VHPKTDQQDRWAADLFASQVRISISLLFAFWGGFLLFPTAAFSQFLCAKWTDRQTDRHFLFFLAD
jgi:hypothetical protein